MAMKRFFSLFVLLFLAASSSLAQVPLQQRLQTRLDEWHKSASFPGATLGVCLVDGKCFALATGYSDRDARTPMKPSDMMLGGSTGKTYVAALALGLVKEGKLGLDDRLETYLGKEAWFARLPNGPDITIRMLMNHTSGLVRYEFKQQFARDITADPDKSWTPAERLAYILGEKPPFEAGKGWEYSDTNYIVLGMVIEKVTGKPYFDLARTGLLEKYRLTRTTPQEGRVIPGVVQGYAGDNNPFGGKDAMIQGGKFSINPQLEWCGGGMATNSEDLARWAKLMYEGEAIPRDLLPQMLDGVAVAPGRDVKYGLGVMIRPTRLGVSYGHSGFFPGYLTDLMYFPEHKISVAVQVNTSVVPNLGGPSSRILVDSLETILAEPRTK